MPSVNEEIQDRAIRHQIQLLRLENNEAQAIIKMLDDEVIPDLVDRIAAHLSRMELSGGTIQGIEAQRLQSLSGAIDEILKRFDGSGPDSADSIRRKLVERLTGIAETEAKAADKVIQDALPIEFETAVPDVNKLRSLVINQPFDGAPLDEWFTNLSNNAKQKITRAVRVGMTEGQTMDQIMRNIRGTVAENYTDGILHKQFRRHAESITRSAVIHSSSQARMEYFTANDDLIKSVQWVATLDTRTCEICMGLDGQEFELDGKQPPAHINCRCVLVPVVKSWKELGIDLDEAPAGTRASMDGQVPAKKTFPEWLENQSAKVQKDALGKGRYELWKAGNVDVKDFVNDRGQILNLEQLKEKAGI